MARFRVGQRVRIVHSRSWPEIIGKEGVIVDSDVYDEDTPASIRGKPCWIVKPDSWPTRHAPRPGLWGGTDFGASEDMIEPLTDCYDTTTWDTCVWQPEHLRMTA